MGKLLSFQINFDNPIYFAGQTMQGQVIVTIGPGGKRTRGLHVTFRGQSEVHWTERHTTGTGNDRREETRHYRNSESYFDARVYLYGNGTETVLQEGEHRFPFSFLLPSTIPSSFEGQHGHVRYHARACIDRPWRFDHNVKGFFTVNNLYDLNKDPAAGLPGVVSNHKSLCCLCCKSGPITASIHIPKSGYVPGEKIFFTADIDNKSNREMGGSGVKFIEKVEFIANSGKVRTERRTIHDTAKGAIPPGDTFTWENVPLVVPALPPSYLQFCNIIQISYHLEFRVDPGFGAFDLTVSVPIIIGSIPLSSTFTHFQPQHYPPAYSGASVAYPPPSAPSMAYPSKDGQPLPPYNALTATPGGMGFASAPPLPVNEYPDLPPPSYEVSVFGHQNLRTDEDNEHTAGNWEYVPTYVTYQAK